MGMHLDLPGPRTLSLDRPVIVGVLNLTPDSFSDGGRYADTDAAAPAARAMLDDGADVIDIGGESTRPGAARIDADEQCRRILPTVEAVVERWGAIVSVDTTLAAVAQAALDAGAAMVNDVSAGRDDPAMLPLIARRGVPVVLMHMRGRPATMQHNPEYDDVVAEVHDLLMQRAAAAVAAGVEAHQIVIDPGIGFGKTTEHNLQLLAALDRLVASGHPVLLGTSRKRFLGELVGETDATRRDLATAATTAAGVLAGVRLFRVHDVKPNRHAADVTFAIASHRNP